MVWSGYRPLWSFIEHTGSNLIQGLVFVGAYRPKDTRLGSRSGELLFGGGIGFPM